MGHQADAILIGASNLRPDNPDLAIPAEEHAARQTCGGPDPTRIVLTSNGDGISPDMRMFDPARGGRGLDVDLARCLLASFLDLWSAAPVSFLMRRTQ